VLNLSLGRILFIAIFRLKKAKNYPYSGYIPLDRMEKRDFQENYYFKAKIKSSILYPIWGKF